MTKKWIYQLSFSKPNALNRNIGILTKEVERSSIPKNVPHLMKEFYARFAPVFVRLPNVQFFPYDLLLGYFNEKSNDLSIIPVSFYNGDRRQMAYIDKNADGSWDYRVQLPVGNGKVSILGEDVFDYLIQLCKRLENK